MEVIATLSSCIGKIFHSIWKSFQVRLYRSSTSWVASRDIRLQIPDSNWRCWTTVIIAVNDCKLSREQVLHSKMFLEGYGRSPVGHWRCSASYLTLLYLCNTVTCRSGSSGGSEGSADLPGPIWWRKWPVFRTNCNCLKDIYVWLRHRERGFTIRVKIFLSVVQVDAARCCHFRSS